MTVTGMNVLTAGSVDDDIVVAVAAEDVAVAIPRDRDSVIVVVAIDAGLEWRRLRAPGGRVAGERRRWRNVGRVWCGLRGVGGGEGGEATGE